jgi:hypothetical protein
MHFTVYLGFNPNNILNRYGDKSLLDSTKKTCGPDPNQIWADPGRPAHYGL